MPAPDDEFPPPPLPKKKKRKWPPWREPDTMPSFGQVEWDDDTGWSISRFFSELMKRLSEEMQGQTPSGGELTPPTGGEESGESTEGSGATSPPAGFEEWDPPAGSRPWPPPFYEPDRDD